ncbi:GntR family transcriptional regulator [Pseudonocardia sp. TRM90224]|uniref:GntR family transcriptional regulator n=1 Tax=Pseudonocardia sp. TRM90224 TaxID=2812678 RepID=UPI001E473902|nr:GntR family transcriptional regulator [Pseudonocardia sp. TRM90224]
MGSVPLYVRIERALRARLADAGPGDPLPSEPALAAEFGVARMTVRAAINRLESDGLVERVPGRGTFARDRPAPRPAGTLMSFHDQVRSWGRTPSSRLLDASVRPATDEERDALQLASRPGQAPDVVSIVRVRMADGIPLAVEHACFGSGLAGLLDVDLEHGSLHAALRGRGLHPTLGSSTITAHAAGVDAVPLAVGEAEPVLVETRLIVDQSAAPLEYTISRYVGARYSLQVTFDVQHTS